MEFSIDAWLDQLARGLRQAFGGRLLFLGLQGSYRRGEANQDSDIDVVTVLDTLEAADLEAYRRILDGMPFREKACGFICGREELTHWPAFDLFQLVHDTRPLLGSLEDLVPPPGRKEAAQAAAIGASNLYHGLCHSFLYGSHDRNDWRWAYKSALFILQAAHFARTGVYISSRRDLAEAVTGVEREILLTDGLNTEDSDTAFARLLAWCGDLLKEMDTKWRK
jgi:hypothetical protein